MARLLIIFNTLVLAVLATSNAALSYDTQFLNCHIERRASARMKGIFTEIFTVPETFDVDMWTAYVCSPPVCDSQDETGSELSIVGGENLKGCQKQDGSALKRNLLFINFRPQSNVNIHSLQLKAVYRARLYARQLVDGPPTMPVESLSQGQRGTLLAASDRIDYNSPVFQNWLERADLRRRSSERDIQFAWRAFQYINAHYTYRYAEDQDRTISQLVRERSTDCGGLSGLLVGTLRANHIPARVLFGKWAQSGESLNDSPLAQKNHVKSEFYAEKIGWIPLEMSGAVEHKNCPTINYFGSDSGDFIALQIDPDIIVDSVMFGKKRIYCLQNAAIWFHGVGKDADSFRRIHDWKVAKQPIR